MNQVNNILGENPLSAMMPNALNPNLLPGVEQIVHRFLAQKFIFEFINLKKKSDPALVRLEKQKALQKVDLFCEALKKHKALIAGGFILNAYQAWALRNKLEAEGKPKKEIQDALDSFFIGSTDADIYVPVENFVEFFYDVFGSSDKYPSVTDDISKYGIFGNKISGYASVGGNIYCESFLRRNGIKAVHRFFPYQNRSSIHFDVMAVRNRRTPLQVVNNFDLTFCQIWFDGDFVYASHPEHVKTKKGQLQMEYLPQYFKGNQFIRRRIQKYRYRGYTIEIPKPDDTVMAIINENVNKKYESPEACTSSTGRIKRYESPEFLHRWATQMIQDWINYHTDKFINPTFRIKPLVDKFKEFFDQPTNVQHSQLRNMFPDDYNGLKTNDGYDSEDVNTSDLKNLKILAKNDFFEEYTPELSDKDEEGFINEDLKFYRVANTLLKELYKNENKQRKKSITETLGETLTDVEGEYPIDFVKPAIKAYLTKIRNVCVRKLPEDMPEEESSKYNFAYPGDEVFDLHAHPLEAGISAENLEAFLNQHKKAVDKTNIACYWQPGSKLTGDESKNCTHTISLDDIRYIVSPAFYKEFIKPVPAKTGLNQTIEVLDVTLANTKSADPLGFGDIHHATMCPFCVQYENRDEGCAYMTHANPKKRPEKESPYCNPIYGESPIRQKYIDAGKQYDEDNGLVGVPPHLEFCIECGRPCYRHLHFDLNDPPGIIENNNPGICTGGGRPELFARILAVRNIYRTMDIKNPIEERNLAILAADDAAKDPDMIAKGQAIFGKPEPERKWENGALPTNKTYNDPAYQNNNSNSNSNGNGNNFANFENEDGKVPEDFVEIEDNGQQAAVVQMPVQLLGPGWQPPPPQQEGGKLVYKKKQKSHQFRVTRKAGKQIIKKRKDTKKYH